MADTVKINRRLDLNTLAALAGRKNGSLMERLAKELLLANKDPAAATDAKFGTTTTWSDKDTPITSWGENVTPTDTDLKNWNEYYGKQVTMQNISEDVTGKQLGGLALGAIKNHPFKAAGLGVLGAGNIGGLTDNDKLGGQLGGLALGGLGSYMMGANPYTAAMLTLGGGELGALFDKLRSKNEQQPQQYQQPYYGGR